MSFLQRVWQKIRNPRGFIGRDLEGNHYFEFPNPNDAWGRPKRVVKYREGYDMWTYIAGERKLPVQWTSWLTHTRIHPPSLEELTADLERQKRIRIRAAMIEARDKEQMAQIAASASTAFVPSDTPTSLTQGSAASSPQDNQRAENRVQGPGASPILSTSPPVASTTRPPGGKPQANDEPQPWTPRAVRRGA